MCSQPSEINLVCVYSLRLFVLENVYKAKYSDLFQTL
jgi:hypothetical protein